MFNDIVASGERGNSSCLQTNMRMLFSAAPRSDIWGKVFAVSLWVSRGSHVSCFVLRCEINEKPFDFPSKEIVHVGRNCELCRRERRRPLVERKKEGENTLMKQFLLIITQFGVSIFILQWGICRVCWKWFDTTPFAREVDCRMFLSLLNVTFLMTFYDVIYFPVKTQQQLLIYITIFNVRTVLNTEV